MIPGYRLLPGRDLVLAVPGTNSHSKIQMPFNLAAENNERVWQLNRMKLALFDGFQGLQENNLGTHLPYTAPLAVRSLYGSFPK